MKLLLDLGNTRLKWAWQAASGDWLVRGAVDWREDVAAVLQPAWAALPRPTRAIAASVVDAPRESLVATQVEYQLGLPVDWLHTPAQGCGVRNAYVEPQRLGVDRFLAMVAAHAAAPAPHVLVGVGTALTLDALAADGQHLGGLIAPGPQLMQQSLFEAATRVNAGPPGKLVELADNTADAVASGCWLAAAALVDRFAARMTARLGDAPQLVLGGGDAANLLPLLSQSARLSEDGVLRGLAIWANAR